MGNIGFIDTGTIGQITTVSSVTSTIGAAVVFPTTSTLGAAVTIPTSSTIIAKLGEAAYTSTAIYYQYVASTALATIWTPAAGKRFNITDLMISTSTSSDITLIDNTNTISIFYFDNRGGLVSNLRSPYVSSSITASLRVATTTSTVSIFVNGFEA